MFLHIFTHIKANHLNTKGFGELPASSVFPTSVGPEKRNEPTGRRGAESPALESLIAETTCVIASSCP